MNKLKQTMALLVIILVHPALKISAQEFRSYPMWNPEGLPYQK
ncbi:hypothetical protein UNH65_19420 [Chitinophaga sp. 180180018-2]|nr:hypothetical protein [Chitinophaga sp. 212800010-3]